MRPQRPHFKREFHAYQVGRQLLSQFLSHGNHDKQTKCGQSHTRCNRQKRIRHTDWNGTHKKKFKEGVSVKQ